MIARYSEPVTGAWRSMLRRGLPVVALALAVSACGTTVPNALTNLPASDNAATNVGVGSGAPAASGAAAGPRNSGLDGPLGHTGAGVPQPSAPGQNTQGGRARPELPISARQSGRGYDAKHMRIGVNTINNASTFFSTVGASITFGDMKADAEAILAGINARGGVLGRKVLGAYHDEDVSEATTRPSSNAQRTCAALTQDNSVVAAAINNTAGDDNDTFYRCMKMADTPFFSAADLFLDQQWFGQYRGYLHSTQGPSADFFAPVLMQRLAQLGYFSKWNTTVGGPGAAEVRLGLLFPDNGVGRRSAALLTRLASSRAASTTTFFYAPETIGESSAAVQSAVVKFRSGGVTHVIAPDPNVDFFMIAAEQQQYRPRYGVNSLMQLSQMQQIVPSAQLVGALGVGWQPYADVEKRPENQAARSCMNDLKRGRVDYGGNAVPWMIALYICDEIRLITESVKAGGGFSTAHLAQGLAKVGPTFQSAVTFRSGFSASRSDIVGGVRDIAYQTGCSCFAYTSSKVWPV